MSVGNGSLFMVNSSSGELLLLGQLDFETQTLHTVIVRATDGGTPPLFDEVAVSWPRCPFSLWLHAHPLSISTRAWN
jgi:hypothetical protein